MGGGVKDYSEQEIKLDEKWVNGKPIYRKVIYIGSLPNATIKTISDNTLKLIGTMTRIYGVAQENGDRQAIPLPYVGDIFQNNAASKNFIKLYVNCNQGIIYITTADDRSTYYGYVILEYTKTTD